MRNLILVILLTSALLLYGCASSGGQPASGTGKSGTDQVSATPANNGGSPSGSVVADNKTGYDKTQKAIELAVADGSYSTEVTYAQPKGNTSAKLNITVKNDTITAASASGINADPWSMKIIGDFNAALPDLVVGKKITELSMPKNVAGSSLTTAAFKQYVEGLVQNN